MTNFWTLFKSLFKQKSRSAYLILALQAAFSLVALIITAFSTSNSNKAAIQMYGHSDHISVFVVAIITFAGIFFVTTFFADFAYLIITAWKGEKINRSQTWRLVPMKDGMIYLCNTISSFCTFIYLIIMQFAVGLVCALISYLSSSAIRKDLALALKEGMNNHGLTSSDFSQLFFLVLFCILLGLFWYVIISLLHFTSRAIIDFLPFSSNKFMIFIIRALVLVAVVYFLIFATNAFGNLLSNPSFLSNNSLGSDLLPAIIQLFLLDVIIGGINYFLIDKFVEARQNN